jgi:hypothetical protein
MMGVSNMQKKTKITKPWPIANLEYLHSKGKLWLNPEYQRESVWTLSQNQLLLDSLLIDIDIPKLYFREIEKNGYEYEVVDGQQRLRAIFDFFHDKFPMPLDADAVEGHDVKGCTYSKLHTDIQMKLRNSLLDIVTLNTSYTDEDIEEIFLRLQNGTPLNAAEKRRAIPGNMKAIVQDMAKDPIFTLAGFKDKRYAYEDVVAKVLHLLSVNGITDIRPLSIKKTYERHKDITQSDANVQRAAKAFRFLVKAFKGGPSPQLKRFSIITLSFLTIELLDKYDLSQFPTEFAKAYISFEVARRENEELPEEKQDPRLAAYTDAARSDSIQDMQYRHDMLREMIVRAIPDLSLKDPLRGFTDEQRQAIYWRDKGECQNCGKKCDENAYHADHKVPHSKGGQTCLSNGQVLCPDCNTKKGNRV